MSSFGVRVLKRADTCCISDDVDLGKTRYGFGVSWDTIHGRDVDVDLQCVVIDNNGTIIDCAYYNNLKAVRAITHSGDEAAGKINNISEMVWVNFRKLPPNVACLVFVVAAYSGGCLKDVMNGKLHVLEESESREIALFEMEQSSASVDVVAAMFRSPGAEHAAWKLRIIDEPAEHGKHFMDILPLLSRVIRGFLPHAPTNQKVAFAMEKGGVLDLPQELAKIVVGLGWDVDDGECDLDVSAVLVDRNGKDLEVVFFGRLKSEKHDITHSGDNLTGEGDGDDEQIIANLQRIGEDVQQVVFVVNIYTPNLTFRQVANPYCRVVDESTGAELCRYALRDAGSDKGLIVARIARETGNRWGFHALGLPCQGSMYKDALPQIRKVCCMKTSSLLPRSSTENLSSFSSVTPSDMAAHASPAPFDGRASGTKGDKCTCTVQ